MIDLIHWYVLQLDAMIHPFFDELRDPNTRLPNGRYLPPLFNFKPQGKSYSQQMELAVPLRFLVFLDAALLMQLPRVYRVKRPAFGDLGKVDSRACEKTVSHSHIVIYPINKRRGDVHKHNVSQFTMCCCFVIVCITFVCISRKTAIYYSLPETSSSLTI